MKTPKIRVGFVLVLMIAVGLLTGCAAPLYNAAELGNVHEVRKLLDQGADINEMSVEYGTALGAAAAEGRIEVMGFLLDHGADINMGRGWWTPLAAASARGQLEAIRLLLDRGADIDAKSPAFGYTPLWWAAYRGQTSVVQLLLDRGADCCESVRDLSSVNTPLKAARDKGYDKIVRLLQQAEARLSGASPAPPAAVPASAGPPVVTVPVSDVDTPPSRRVKVKVNAYAIVIGIDTYRNKLPQADFASHDAKVMGDYLTKVMGYEEENVAILINDRAAKTDLEKYVEHWLPNRVEPGASVFIYFSGHGSPNPKTGSAYLVPYDGDPAFIDATGYPLKRLYDRLGKLPAKEVVVMLDSCFSGAGGRSVIAKGMRPLVLSLDNPVLAGGKIVVLAASQGDQVSSTYHQKSHGLLTYYFLKGLQGDAVKNKDGTIDLAEIFDFVKPQVERKARRDFNNEQTPQLLGSPKLLSKGIRLVERPIP